MVTWWRSLTARSAWRYNRRAKSGWQPLNATIDRHVIVWIFFTGTLADLDHDGRLNIIAAGMDSQVTMQRGDRTTYLAVTAVDGKAPDVWRRTAL